jgi:Rps23 Pro-64 3,4-dihydroxylase Tpa1-like proline 4-hydroxylase
VTPFKINPNLDVASLRQRFQRDALIQIDDFLAPKAARALQQELESSNEWRHVINGADKVFEIPADEFDALGPAFMAQLDEATHRSAAHGFQFQYDSIRVPDSVAERLASSRALDEFATALSSDAALSLFREIAGGAPIAFADAQATRYRPRDFLTRHDDAIAGKDRVLAYVLNLVDEWRPEWGGLLSFVSDGDRIAETFVPRFNSLSLFAVGQQHFVSPVAEYAPLPRLSVTGWLRTRVPVA